MRIFVFGCSFTKYIWPTWADMLQESNPVIEILNFARSGIGNYRISLRLQELVLKGHITEHDLVIVVWTSWHREDRYVNGKWAEEGNVFNAPNFGNEFTQKYWDHRYDIIRNASSIIGANTIRNINVNGGWINIRRAERYPDSLVPEDTSYHEIDLDFKFYLDYLPKFLKFDQKTNTYFSGKCTDAHPDMWCHYDYAQKISRRLGLNNPNLNVWLEYQNKIEDAIHSDMYRHELWNTITKTINWPHEYTDPIKIET